MVDHRKKFFFSSGEINFRVKSPNDCLTSIKAIYSERAISVDEIDGISIMFENWRFNLRQSNTEALVRVNVETTKDLEFLKEKTHEITQLVAGFNR